MSIAVACPACGRKLQLLDKNAGRRISCPDCGKSFTAPDFPLAEDPEDINTPVPVAPRRRSPVPIDEVEEVEEEPESPKSSASSCLAVVQVLAIVMHVLAAAVLVVLAALPTRPMALFCLVPGVLTGCVIPAVLRNRPVTLYAAFGVLMGYAFWDLASSINQGHFLDLLAVCILAASTAWLLQQPSWPPLLLTEIMGSLLIGFNLLAYSQRFDWTEPEYIARSTGTALGILCTGMLYGALGFWEASLRGLPPKPRENRSRKRRKRL
jgi:hypothetical protein